MKKEDVLNALDSADNEPVSWAIGGLLRQRLEQDGWEDISVLQHLATCQPNLKIWNALFK